MDGYYSDPKTKRLKRGTVVVLQEMGRMPDGKLHLVAGVDETVFHLEEGDRFYTAVFAVDPFKTPEEESSA